MKNKSKKFTAGILLVSGLQAGEPCLEALHNEQEPQGEKATLSTKRVTLPPDHHTHEQNEAPQSMPKNLTVADSTASTTINMRGLSIKVDKRIPN